MPCSNGAALAAVVALVVVTTACTSVPPGRSAIDSVSISGTEHLDVDEMAARIVTQPSPKFLGLFRGLVYDYTTFDDMVFARDLARLARYCQARGYFDAKVRARSVSKQKDRHVRVEIEVEEGPVTLIGSVAVEGTDRLPEPLAVKATALAARQLEPGAPFDEEKFRGSEDGLRSGKSMACS